MVGERGFVYFPGCSLNGTLGIGDFSRNHFSFEQIWVRGSYGAFTSGHCIDHSLLICLQLMQIRHFTDPQKFIDRAGPWLLQREAENNNVLVVLDQLLRGNHSYQQPIYLAVIEDEGEVQGCAFRTPPFGLGLTRLPLSAMPLLVQDVARLYPGLPSVMGPEAEARHFADLWTSLSGANSRVTMHMGIHALESIEHDAADIPGTLRLAGPDDRELVFQWVRKFVEDTGMEDAHTKRRAEQMMKDGAVYLWEDDAEPRSMVAAGSKTPNGVRVGYVYSPPSCRGKGYATAITAAVSQRMLDTGKKYCFLYTDLANPTSNAIYRRIGYRKVCEVVDIRFSDRQ